MSKAEFRTAVVIGAIVAFITSFVLTLAYSKRTDALEITAPETVTTLEISNPYSFDVGCEIKCDWNGKKYTYYNHTVLPGKKISKIVVPKNLTRCELWPYLKF